MAKKNIKLAIPDEIIMNQIYYIREQKVMLDFDLSQLYQIETKRLKEQVKRNLDRFPSHFMFELTVEENESLRSQFSNLKRGEHSKYPPYAFTEHGVLMLSNVLKSGVAVQVSIKIIDVFVKLRQELSDKTELKKAIDEIKKKTDNNTKNIEVVFQYLDELVEKKEKPREQIGYKINRSKNSIKIQHKKKVRS